MVLGIGEGSLEITLDKYSFTPGETITGKVQLKLNQPKKARALRIEFYGEVVKGSGKNRRVEKVHLVSSTPFGERTYGSETIPFTLAIPSGINYPQPQGFVESLFAQRKPHGWFVNASLDVPNEFDINKRTTIVLLDAQGKPI